MIELNSEQLRVLRHMLGIDRPEMDVPKPYRDYYCTTPGDPTMAKLLRVSAVRLYATRGDMEWYTCTPEGRAAGIASHKAIRYSPAKRRYIRFLDIRDCMPDLTFREFLTNPRFKASEGQSNG